MLCPQQTHGHSKLCPFYEKIIRQIYEAGKGVSQAGLGRHLGISARCAGKKVAKAMAAGLVENVGSATGCRGQAIRLTTKGRALIGVVV